MFIFLNCNVCCPVEIKYTLSNCIMEVGLTNILVLLVIVCFYILYYAQTHNREVSFLKDHFVLNGLNKSEKINNQLDSLWNQNKVFLSSRQECVKNRSFLVNLLDLSSVDPMLQTFSPDENVFFLETSGRPTLNIRQVCAIESSCRTSGRNVFLLMMSESIDVCSEGVTHNNYQQRSR